jgi:hypothetical protein
MLLELHETVLFGDVTATNGNVLIIEVAEGVSSGRESVLINVRENHTGPAL